MQGTSLLGFINLLPDAAVVVDTGHVIMLANDRAKALLGPSDLTRTRLALSTAPNLGERRFESNLSSAEGVVTLRTSAGVEAMEFTASQVLVDDTPALLVLLRRPRANTSRELARALQHNEQRLALATQVSKVGIFDHDVSAPPEAEPYWSPALRQLLGVDEAQAASFEWYRGRIHRDDLPRLDAAVAASMDPSGTGSIDLEYRWHHPDGQMRWLLVRASTLYTEIDGRRTPIRCIGAVLDVTERHVVEEEHQRRAAILDATPDVVAITDLDGNLSYLNQAGRRLMGIEATADIGTYNIGSAQTSATRERWMREGIPAATRAGVWTAELEFLRHDGEIVPMSQVLLAHRDTDDNVVQLTSVARDLSKERLLEDQFRHAQKMEAIGRLAGGVAHDFNNLLSVIWGFTELAADELSPEHPAAALLTEVQRAAERAASLTEQLLAFSRKKILKLRVLDINEVLADITPMMGRLVDDSIQVRVFWSSQPVRIKVDPNQMQQVLLNLVVNARDAMPDGGVLTLEAERVTLDVGQAASKLDVPPGTYALIAVSDTGHGMDEATRRRVFEPFFTTKGPGRGTGLGLSTVFGIVRQSGGSIWLYSEPGRGTTFKIYIPCTEEPLHVAASNTTTVPTTQSGVILVTEDDVQLRSMLSNVLTRAGFQVLSAASPSEALEIAKRHPHEIDLLLTDVLMPGMNGKQLADKLSETRPETAVLFMSGYTENTIVHHGVLDEGLNFVAKPVTPQRLLGAIHEVLSGNGTYSEA